MPDDFDISISLQICNTSSKSVLIGSMAISFFFF